MTSQQRVYTGLAVIIVIIFVGVSWMNVWIGGKLKEITTEEKVDNFKIVEQKKTTEEYANLGPPLELIGTPDDPLAPVRKEINSYQQQEGAEKDLTILPPFKSQVMTN